MTNNFNRIFLVVLDGVGAGELPDANLYGDVGANTLVHIAEAAGVLNIPNLVGLGIANIQPLSGIYAPQSPLGAYGRLAEQSPGKDSVTGHWEMAGIVLKKPFPTYANGFPPAVMLPFEAAIGIGTIGNLAASGTEILDRLGAEHMTTGKPIIYTSADSVFQIAAHEAVIPVDRLYQICEIARRQLAGEHAVGRVIARPFVGEPGSFKRTENRKDYPLPAPRNLLDELCEAGFGVHAIGKISEFFDGRAISRWDHTTNNADHIAALQRSVETSEASLIFANLEDFDMLYGHRNDVIGMAAALETWDMALEEIINSLHATDLMIITADHGNDPTTASTDHSREYPFLLAYGAELKSGVDLGIRQTFSDIAATIRDVFDLPDGAHGTSFHSSILPE